MSELKYKRILLKLSGEALAGADKYGINAETLEAFCQEILDLSKQGVQIGIVVGGGNIFRGIQGTKKGIDRAKGDSMGMLATTINAIAIQSMIQQLGGKAKVLTSTLMEPYAERFSQNRAITALEEGYIVVFSGGTGNPYFTTDSASALRGLEIKAEVLLKGTRVDGIYTADPEKDPNATKFDEITFDETIQRKLKVMDLTAFALCSENNLPIMVFDMNQKGNLEKIVKGEKIGTLVK
ncbi:MAG: UMP kinase [Bacteroidales bacterium]|jgi:uridylate kinase|nr:UMP kinase [Bacteroidales bacterium]